MRAVSGIWLLMCVLACTVCHAEVQFPYELTVRGDRVEVRSGPSRKYYVTDRLSNGEKIEVYRHEADGWLAIRPTSRSYSLVEKKNLQITAGKSIAKVRRDDIPSRIGSRALRVDDYVTHVQLRQDELVELYDSTGGSSRPLNGVNDQWIAIWPPAGEFRWVHSDDVPQSNGTAVADSVNVQSNSKTDPGGWQARPEDPSARLSPDTVNTRESVDPPGDWNNKKSMTDNRASESRGSSTAEATQEDTELVRVPSETARPEIARAKPEQQPVESSDVVDEREDPRTPGRRWVPPNRKPSNDVGSLDLELAMMVSQEMRAWRLDALADRVHETLGRLNDESERVRARRLLARISEFEDLLNRASEASEASVATSGGNVAPLIGSRPPAASTTIRGVTYDGTGVLVPVHASKGTVPPYALLDPQGDVLHYISPTPGLNLQRYVRKQIGVFGNRGYIPALNKPHVTAQRVVDLDRHLR